MLLVPTSTHTPLTIDALLSVIAERDAEVAHLKLMIDKLKAQLARRVREQYGRSSEQLDAQLTFITADAPKASTGGAAAPASHTRPRKPRRDQRKLPEHLPRETQVHKGIRANACGCSEWAEAGQIGRRWPSNGVRAGPSRYRMWKLAWWLEGIRGAG